MSYLEIVKSVDRDRIYRGQAIRYRIVVVLCSLVLVLGSVRGGCSDGMCDSKVGGDSAVVMQEITAPENWAASSKITEDLTTHGFSLQDKKSVVYVKKHITEEVTAVASDSTVALSPTNSTENIDMYMVLWPEPELQFTIPKISEVGGLQRVLNTLNNIVVIKADKVVFIYNVEHVKRLPDRSDAIFRIINTLKCKELELIIEEYDIERYSQWVSIVDCGLTQLQETIDYAASNPNRNLTINVCCLNPSRVDLIGLKLSQRKLVAKLTLIVTVIQDQKRLLTYRPEQAPESHARNVEASTNINFTALHNQEIQCQKIVLINELDNLTVTGLEDAIQGIYSEIVLELRWDTLLCLIQRNNPVIKVHTIIVIVPPLTKELFRPEFLQEQPHITLRIFAVKIVTQICTEECPCIEGAYNQCYTPEVYAKYGISVGESTFEYKRRQNGLLDTLKILENKLHVDCEKVVEQVESCGIQCPGEEYGDNKWEFRETVNISLDSLCNKVKKDKYNDYIDTGTDVLFCQNICYTDIHINSKQAYGPSELCQSLLKLFINITARTLRISNVTDGEIGNFDLSKREGQNTAPETYRRRLDLKTLILDNVANSLIYWILNSYIFADSMEVHILNQGYKNLNIARILSLPICQNISKLVLNDFVGLDEVKYYEEYKKEDRLTELSLFNYIETMKAENKTTTDLGLNKLVLQLEGLDCNKYTEILAKFKSIGIQCEVVPLVVIVGRQIVNYKSYIKTATRAALRDHSKPIDKGLELKNINLQDLEADIASRCAMSTSQPDPNQEQESPIQKLSIDKLSLFFRDTQFITEHNLVKILEWIACQFVGPKSLYFYHLEVSEDERKKMLVGNYHINGLDAFKYGYMPPEYKIIALVSCSAQY
ncbi:hypothetical protein NEHOM01_0231 [Nematocida homosporus]|uniref:uncharacterized protein n=1 Tax=Nematocida homosporus TaxID=1912981 RepID=UPI00222086F1|nr:uncharacterized protein NEHOM01_0231 [Nematocida homosporus]KAI5184556.1 hypothetical protein NEHOM01_0231 [Nematocida homosporus]